MKKKVLALLDSNTVYMKRLQRYLEDNRGIPFTICAFTGEDKMKEYLEREAIDYLIVSEDLKIEHKKIGRVMTLYDEGQNDGLYRFTSGDRIVERLKDIIGKEEFEAEADDTIKTSFVGCYSPVSRTLKTSFCMVLGQMLAKKYKVLYLNFESYSGMRFEGVIPERNDLSDLMYYFDNLKDEFADKLKSSVIHINNLDIIYPAFCYTDISYISGNRWDEFLTELSSLKLYDYIILDLSDYLQGLFDSFLLKCSVIYTLTANDQKAQNKIFHYEQILNKYNYGEILEKTRKCLVPTIRNLPENIDGLLYSELSDFVRKETMRDFNWEN